VLLTVQTDGPSAPDRSARRAVVHFALAGLVVLAVFLAGSLVVFRDLGRSEAIRDARQFAVLTGQGIVEPMLRNGLVEGDPEAVDTVDRVVQERVLGERIVRVKIWSRDGRIVYSDEPRLIGSRYPLGQDKLDVLEKGSTRAELSDLSGPENRFERGEGDLYEVYLGVRAPDGTPLVFETYQRANEVTSTGRRIWLPFAALLLACLVLLWLVQVPLAWRLARRLERSQHEREMLLTRSLEASADERRRIAADLHDGVVQDLAGISYSLAAAAEQADASVSAELRSTLEETADGTRDSMRRIRSLIVEIHPPNLRAAGLEAAVRDLLAPLHAHGVETELTVADDVALPEDVELLFYRAAGEALRNAERHAGAGRVKVAIGAENGRARLVVRDDGAGFADVDRERRRAEGHVGLTLLEELAARAGGTVRVESRPGAGTTFTLEAPL
jgi:two-component system NarL family sensor kinase